MEAVMAKSVDQPMREFWSASALAVRFGCHKTTIFRRVARGEFPPPIYVAPGRPVWREAIIQAWLDEIEERSA